MINRCRAIVDGPYCTAGGELPSLTPLLLCCRVAVIDAEGVSR